ncbi:UbiA family prenyltransferase [Halosolutus gelatinilyticus]|uniref:UbiA family prenyltransferase n=1 Tax=Halosolutus gelatinilyticus TaxID=2931975 RepID=UPI001FF0F03D|nr:UbiA family prenyltransferase [Halosolutus gelatinilyticus]
MQPIFLVPAPAVSAFGALLADDPTGETAAVHALAVGLAVYVAHLKDGYVDYYVRSEDGRNPLEPAEIWIAIVAAIAAFAVAVGLLWTIAGLAPVALTAPLVGLGLLHAPYLDANPVTSTADYPLGIGLATAGGYATQTGTVSPAVAAVALAFVVQLAGIGVLLDLLDYRHDRLVSKRTVPVVLGRDRAPLVAWTLVAAGASLVVLASSLGVLPRRAALAGAFPVGALLLCLRRRYPTDRAVLVLIAATYPFAVALLLAIRPNLLG